MKRYIIAIILFFLISPCYAIERAQPFHVLDLSGGLNSSDSALQVGNSESSDCQNIYTNTKGSIIKRSGFAKLNSHALQSFWTDADGVTYGLTNSQEYDGLTQFKLTDGTIYLVAAASGLYKMDDLDGVWDDITGSITIQHQNQADWVVFTDKLIGTNNADTPFLWTGAGTARELTLPVNVTAVKFVETFANRLWLANVTKGSTVHTTTVYWSNLRDPDAWVETNFIDVSPEDGEAISGLKRLGNALVVYKDRSIHNLFRTGNSTVPFKSEKSLSEVGCAAGGSVQGGVNNHAFLSGDGIYTYNGVKADKISERISTTLDSFELSRNSKAVSAVYRKLNQYWLALTEASDGTSHDVVIVYDYFNDAFTVYRGINISGMTIIEDSDGFDRLYTGAYDGFTYRQDSGTNDDGTAIDAYWWSRWFDFGNPAISKWVQHIYVYTESEGNYDLSLGYTIDFSSNDSWKTTQLRLLEEDALVWDVGNWDEKNWAGSVKLILRKDLEGKGHFIRFKFFNSGLDEEFQVDGFSAMVAPQGYN